MRTLLTIFAVVGVSMAGGCERERLRMREETQVQFDARRPDFEALADKVLLCKGLISIRLKDRKPRPCLGGAVTRREIIADLRRLKLKGAHWADDGRFVLLVNGESHISYGGTPWSHSGMIRLRSVTPDWDARNALTPPPHHWYYTQNN